LKQIILKNESDLSIPQLEQFVMIDHLPGSHLQVLNILEHILQKVNSCSFGLQPNFGVQHPRSIDHEQNRETDDVTKEHPKNGEIENHPNVDRAKHKTQTHLDNPEQVQDRMIELTAVTLDVSDHRPVSVDKAVISKILAFHHFGINQQRHGISKMVANALQLEHAKLPQCRSEEHTD
jgi:hypothetical protein